ncbi:MAG: tRNA (guanosine(37)-N1)-methyltransferase TrmD [Candidatus Omnitrophica bacterium]|nr:tRNA (guanosine(37)-N1)-methyltransferase TrmD [Candidatus Omnitrophota bacterium]
MSRAPRKEPALTIEILTLFPEMFAGPFRESMIRLAKEKGLVKIKVHNLRRWARDKHRSCDDKPYGGGAGMVMMVEPIHDALEHLKAKPGAEVVLLSPQGERFSQDLAWELARRKRLILICGHYEGVDERVREHYVDREISVGDFVLTGGELPAMCVADSLVRLVPGVVGNQDSIRHESFQEGLLEYPHYTRPREFRGMTVPDVLLSGDHKKVEEWRKKQALARTRERRPDLWHKLNHKS